MNFKIPPISILAASALISVFSMTDTANAAIFGFSFSNVDGLVNGVVEGTVELPDGDGMFSATAVTINSFPTALGLPPAPIDALAAGFEDNTFMVTDGEITGADLLSRINIQTGFSLSDASNNAGPTFLDALNAEDFGATGVLDNDSFTLVFTSSPVSTPEPDSVLTFLSLGLFGIVGKFASKHFQ